MKKIKVKWNISYNGFKAFIFISMMIFYMTLFSLKYFMHYFVMLPLFLGYASKSNVKNIFFLNRRCKKEIFGDIYTTSGLIEGILDSKIG